MRSFFVASLAWLPLSTALACEPFAETEWHTAVNAVDMLYTASNLKKAGRLLEWTEDQLPCLDTLVHPSWLGRYAQQMSFHASMAQDAEVAEEWARLARVTAPTLKPPSWMPPGHMATDVLADVEPPVFGLLDKSLIHPRRGGVFLNGEFLVAPTAPISVTSLLQTADSQGRITAADWQHGMAFDDEILAPATGQNSEPPTWYVPGPQRSLIQEVETGNPKRVLTTAAVATGAGAAALYGASWGIRAAYVGAPSDGLRTGVNSTFIASTVVGTTALGLLTAALASPGGR